MTAPLFLYLDHRVNMNVRIDQPWHQNAAGAVDHLVIGEGRAVGNLAENTGLNNNVFRGSQRFRFAVRDADGAKYNSRRHRFVSST